MNRLTPIALALPLLCVSTAVFAASTPQAVLDDPNRPVEAVAAELGVTPLEFATCFAGVTPARSAAELGGQRERDNKQVLLPCLQAINPALDNGTLDAVMDNIALPHRAEVTTGCGQSPSSACRADPWAC